MSDRDTIERAIRHIDSCLDVDPWARNIAIDAMQRLLDQASYRKSTGTLDIWDALSKVYNMDNVPEEAKSIIGDVMLGLQSEEPEPERNTTSGQPVSGKLGVKTGETCADTISRQAAIKAVHEEFDECTVWDESGEYTADEVERILDSVPSAQPDLEEDIPMEYFENGGI